MAFYFYSFSLVWHLVKTEIFINPMHNPLAMSQYYLGDPCYVIPDAEWGDFCSIMRDDGEDFDFKGETCRVIGTGGDGDFGGISVDAGVIGVIPVSLCDSQKLKNTVPSCARLINKFATLEKEGGDIIIVDGEALNGYQCECDYCGRRGDSEWMSLDEMSDCFSCGRMVGQSCIEYGDEGEYCSDECKEDQEPEEKD